MRLSKTKNVNLTTHHASKIAILLIFLIAVLFVAVHLHAQSKGIIEPVKLPNPTTPKAPQGMKMVADVLDAVGGKSEAGSVKMQISSGGQPSAIGKSQDTAYKLFAGYVYPTEVPQPPTFIAHFMTPEGEPYPFDVTISDGEWIQVFDSVTYIETAVPCSASYLFRWKIVSGSMPDSVVAREFYNVVRIPIAFGEVKEFDFYALNAPLQVNDIEPQVFFAERGANLSLSHEYFPDTKTFVVNMSTVEHKTGECIFPINILTPDMQKGYHKVYHGVLPGSPGVQFDVKKKRSPWEAIKHYFERWSEWGVGYVCVMEDLWGEPWPASSRSDTFFLEVRDTTLGGLRIVDVLYNNRTFLSRGCLTNINDPSISFEYGLHLPLIMPFPDFYNIPTGSYSLTIHSYEEAPPGLLPVTLPVNLGGGSRGQYLCIYPFTTDLAPYTFSVVGENPFGFSSYSNLFHAPGDSITVEVRTETKYDWWGYFVLPKDLAVDRLFAYSDTLGEEELADTLDYIINHIEGSDLFLVVVRNEPYYDRLKLEYASRGDANGDGVINVTDVVYLINYLFIGGPEPIPMEAGDLNCDGLINVSDVVYLINYLYIGGPPPCS